MIIDIVLGYVQGRGGLEEVLTLITREMCRRGHRPRVFLHKPPVEHTGWAASLPEVYYYDPARMDASRCYPGEVDLFRWILGYRSLIDHMGMPDVIIATHTPLLGTLCHLAVCHKGIDRPPILSWLHGPADAYGGGEMGLGYCDAHLTISNSIAESIRKLFKEEVPIYLVNNPIKLDGIKRIPRPANGFELIYMGRLHNQQKRLDILFQALAPLDEEWHLHIFGEGQDEPKLRQLAAGLKVSDRISWHGWKRDPWNHIEDASALVLTSDYEGLPLVLVEALARGIPVIATNCAGSADIVQDGVNGWSSLMGQVEPLTAILRKVLRGEVALPSPEVCEKSVAAYRAEAVVDRMLSAINYTLAFQYPS